jgi:hypothetical protein
MGQSEKKFFSAYATADIAASGIRLKNFREFF